MNWIIIVEGRNKRIINLNNVREIVLRPNMVEFVYSSTKTWKVGPRGSRAHLNIEENDFNSLKEQVGRLRT